MTEFKFDPRLARADAPVAKAEDIAFVMFRRPDLALMSKFMTDFGMTEVECTPERLVMRGARQLGPAHVTWKADKPGFRGLALRVRNEADLQALAELPGASVVEPLDLPGGGSHVRLIDPAGFDVWAVHGQAAIATDELRSPIPANTTEELERLNAGVRPPAIPATVLRPGHCVLGAIEFFATAQWYIQTFGLIPSDIQYLDDGSPALTFLRCDRGETPADHHTVVVSQNVVNTYSHSAYEVIDLDDVAMGQEHLLSRGWKHAWGVGRHLLGSQIFDYWRDPYGDKVEHYADGDRFEASVETGHSLLNSAGLYQWGPPVPKDFEKPKMSIGFLIKLFSNIKNSKELDFARVKRLMAAIDAPSRPWQK